MTAVETSELSASQRAQIYRRNFFLFTLDGVLFMVAMGTIGVNTVIPDFVRRLTDSEILIGLSGSMFGIGFTLPQLFIARYIIRFERKKWWFIGPNIPVRFVILIFAFIVVLLGENQPGAILLVFLLCYGIAAVGDGLVGVPWADLIGTSLDNRWRARMFGFMSACSGLIMLGVAPVIAYILSAAGPGFPNNYALLFGIAGVLFAFSILPVLFVRELPGVKAASKSPAFSEFLPELGRVLRNDLPFRAIVITRMFTSLFAMAIPFYVGYATVQLGLSSEVAVPNLLAMQTVGSIAGALVYTWIGARNNVLYIRLALIGAALLPLSALLSGVIGPLLLYFGFLMSGLSLSNLMFGYQNWLVTYAPADKRPIYVGLFNTISAVISLITPFISGTIARHIGFEALFGVALMMALSAFYVTLRFLPSSQRVTV